MSSRERDQERTAPLTGSDASPSEAFVDLESGNGASPHGADLTGGVEPFEPPPHPEDILPDSIERKNPPAEDEDEVEVTAQPADKYEPATEHASHD